MAWTVKVESIPEPPINPPSPSEADYYRLNRNSIRQDVIDAIGLIGSRLNELSDTGFDNILRELNELRELMFRDWEE